jgi:hypothetical protein
MLRIRITTPQLSVTFSGKEGKRLRYDVSKHHAVESHREYEVEAPCILDLSDRWKVVTSCTFRQIFPQENRLGTSRSGHGEKSLTLMVIEPLSFSL